MIYKKMNDKIIIDQLQKYVCHKEVRAEKIKDIDKSYTFLTTENGNRFEMELDYRSKYNPKIGGYVAFYADSYMTYIPAEIFEKLYNKANDTLCTSSK